MVLTGAGCSTASGIPDYRDELGEWKHSRPVQYADFVSRPTIRRRYWGRSLFGWPRMAAARANAAHFAIAELQRRGRVSRIVTQNVDGLHEAAGATEVIDLHGRLDEVACLGCGWRTARARWQAEIGARNADWMAGVTAARDAPDGDAVLEDADYERVVVPDCPACGEVVKPEVVFFGEAVPGERVRAALAALEASDGLLVIGSSLMVYSGFRFARRAHEARKGLAILTRGRTRADGLATLKLNAECGATLEAALALL